MVASKKHFRILQDHLKKGNTFYPPFTFLEGVGRFEEINWRADFVPELIWIALLVKEYGFDKAKNLACMLAITAMQLRQSEQLPDFGIVSSYSPLDPSTKQNIVDYLEDKNVLQEIVKPLLPLLTLYPDCPLSFLFVGCENNYSSKEAAKVVAPVLEECLFRGEKLPTFVQAVYYDLSIVTGKLNFVAPLKPHHTDPIKDYPQTDESQKLASILRANASQITIMCHSKEWPKKFWRKGRDIGPCMPERPADLYLNNFPQEFILFNTECFKEYHEACNSLWEFIEKNYVIDFYSPLKDEILLSLACRIYRLTVHVVSFMPNWTEDIAEVFLRMIIESYIYYQWFNKNGTEESYKKFYMHGLGQQKLRKEHTTNYLKQQGVPEDEIDKYNPGLSFLKNHKMPEFIPVNIGNPLDKNLRIIAEEADCREIYALIFSPASSAIHGMYDSLERFYTKTCRNPFHCFHKVPYYWYKAPVSGYAVLNCLEFTDWVLAELIQDLNGDLPEKMPGKVFIERINNNDALEEFAQREDVQNWIKSSAKFRDSTEE